MRGLFKKELRILYLRKRTSKRLKRKKKIERRKKHERKLLQGKPRTEKGRIRDSVRFNRVIAPENFSLLDSPEESIHFLNKIENLFNKRGRVFVVLKNVKQIDYSAITVLLSIMYKFKVAKIEFNGDFPDTEAVKKKLVESQFFEKLMKPLSSASDYFLKKENQIFARANKFVLPEIGEPIMEQVSQTVWGTKRVCKGLQRTLLELMQNTNNHASNKEGEVHWWLSVNHNREKNLVDFYFVDYGQGILNSLKNKTSRKIWDGFLKNLKSMFDLNREPDIVKALLDGEHRDPQHRKDPYYRGKGLHGIQEVLNRKQIGDLHIITNNVFIDVSKEKFERLGRGFNGTFYHWQINNRNKSTLWKQ